MKIVQIIRQVVIFERKASKWLHNGSVINRLILFLLGRFLLGAAALLFDLAIEVSQGEEQELDKIDCKGDHNYTEQSNTTAFEQASIIIEVSQ